MNLSPLNDLLLPRLALSAKPDPALFLHAAEKLNAAPENCVVFEDSIWGFKAANAAHMKCIAIKNNRNQDHHSENTHGAIDSYDEAEAVILTIAATNITK